MKITNSQELLEFLSHAVAQLRSTIPYGGEHHSRVYENLCKEIKKIEFAEMPKPVIIEESSNMEAPLETEQKSGFLGRFKK